MPATTRQLIPRTESDRTSGQPKKRVIHRTIGAGMPLLLQRSISLSLLSGVRAAVMARVTNSLAGHQYSGLWRRILEASASSSQSLFGLGLVGQVVCHMKFDAWRSIVEGTCEFVTESMYMAFAELVLKVFLVQLPDILYRPVVGSPSVGDVEDQGEDDHA